MPEYATIAANVKCWNCASKIDSIVNIQWGMLPAGYQLGEDVQWLSINHELVPPFILVGGQEYWNCGDPKCTSLLALDCDVYALEADTKTYCPTCNEQIGVVAVRIEDNRVVSVDSFSERQFSELVGQALDLEADIFTLHEGGYKARTEWYDHSIRYVEQFPDNK